ncbi:DPP IV N-terminal domain-containing protein [Flavobacteriaceae bacterium F08102]|nr:DPP IV N-terminal domain-containing protein [Flavobacteriaceae bacterium F08102]
MNKKILSVLLMASSFFASAQLHVKQQEKSAYSTPNYRLAAKFSPTNIGKMVHSTAVNPIWLKSGNRFWYQYKTTDGANYYIVDPDKRTKRKLFDNALMAKWLTEITKDPYDAQNLPRFNFEFVNNDTAIRFRVTSTEEVEVVDEKDAKNEVENDLKKNDSIKSKKARPKRKPKMEKKVYYLEYKLGDNKLTVINNKKDETKRNSWANIAPDSTMVVYAKNHNLYWMDKENFKKALEDPKDTTIVEHQWTTDGVEHYSYGSGRRGVTNETKDSNVDKRVGVRGMWSHDSKKFVLQRTDARMLKDLWVINSVTRKRPTLETYKYHMPGEQEFSKTEILIFDIASKSKINVKLDTTKQQSVAVFGAPRNKVTYPGDFTPSLLLSKKGKVYYSTISRDRKKYDICVADIETGESKVLIKERFNTYIESQPMVLFNNEQDILHWSERDGWAHIYHYAADGTLKRQLTKGSFHVDGIQKVDEKNGLVYFTASGVTKGQNPYYSHLYRINLNGSGMKNLNPGNFTSSVSMSMKPRYFVSTYSRVDTAPISELRNTNGDLIMKLEEADLSQLFKSGYKFPEPFTMKADDGITDLYGVIYRPFDFDSTKVYPLIEYVYPGPQTEAVNTAFSTGMTRTDRMAQLGFVVVTLGNRGGHPGRSKWYHNYGYGNLRDYGLADKKYVAEQLADKYPYIDIDKVGIFGHSGGGFMSTAAILQYPDFFKVAVSSAGNHDNTIYNSWWSETHHGVKEELQADGSVKYLYDIDKNQELAANLKGKLLLVTGDIDNNVHPGATIRMADALIKANKRFDFMLMPGQRHSFGRMSEYFFWLTADYFTKHLLGVEQTSVDIIEMNRDVPRDR